MAEFSGVQKLKNITVVDLMASFLCNTDDNDTRCSTAVI